MDWYAVGYTHGNKALDAHPPVWDAVASQAYCEGYTEGSFDRVMRSSARASYGFTPTAAGKA